MLITHWLNVFTRFRNRDSRSRTGRANFAYHRVLHSNFCYARNGRGNGKSLGATWGGKRTIRRWRQPTPRCSTRQRLA